MDNSIGAMFMTILQAAMTPMLERIETLEHDLQTQDKELARLDTIIQLHDKTQFNQTAAGVMNLFVEALNNGAGSYREFHDYLKSELDNDVAELFRDGYTQTTKAVDNYLASGEFVTQHELDNQLPDMDNYVLKEDFTENEMDEDKVREISAEVAKEMIENCSLSITVND